MRKQLLVLPLLIPALALGGAAPAPAAAAGASKAPRQAASTTLARFGGGFRGSRPSFGRSRYPRYRSPAYRRPHPFRGLGGSILRALGIAYLVHLLFGWGTGGSPFGLLLVVAVIAWLVTRRRRMRPLY